MALSARDRPCLARHCVSSPRVLPQPRTVHALTPLPVSSPHNRAGPSCRGLCMVSAAGRGGDQLRTPEIVDYWAVLGLERGAGPENVKAAYRRLQKMYHPDSPMVRMLPSVRLHRVSLPSRLCWHAYAGTFFTLRALPKTNSVSAPELYCGNLRVELLTISDNVGQTTQGRVRKPAPT